MFLNIHVVHLLVIGPMVEESVDQDSMAAGRGDVVLDMVHVEMLFQKILVLVAEQPPVSEVFVTEQEPAFL